MNSLPYNAKILKKIINRKVSEAEENSRMLNISFKGITANKWPIAWPPTRKSMNLLFRALNLSVAPTKMLDCLIYCRGPKMEDEPPENFDIDKLVDWFILNLKTLKHIDYNLANPDWLANSPTAVTLNIKTSS